MSGACSCCEQNSELKEYPILEVHVCKRCYATLDRLGGPLLTRAEEPIPPNVKQRLVSAVRRISKHASDTPSFRWEKHPFLLVTIL